MRVATFPEGHSVGPMLPPCGQEVAALSLDGGRVAYESRDGTVTVQDVQTGRGIGTLDLKRLGVLPPAVRPAPGNVDDPTGQHASWLLAALQWVGRDHLWIVVKEYESEEVRGCLVSVRGRPAVTCSVGGDMARWCVGSGPRVAALVTQRTPQQETQRLYGHNDLGPWAWLAAMVAKNQEVVLVEPQGTSFASRCVLRVTAGSGQGNIIGVALSGDLLFVARDVSEDPAGYSIRQAVTQIEALEIGTSRRRWCATYRDLVEFIQADVGHGLSLWHVRTNQHQHHADLWCVAVTGRAPKVLRVESQTETVAWQ